MKSILFAVSSLVFAPFSFAESFTEQVRGSWGFGISHIDSNYTGASNTTKPAPLVFGGFGKVSIDGNRGSYTFYKDGTYYASAIGQFRSNLARDKNDSPAFSALGDRKSAFELGVSIGRRLPNRFGTNIAFLTDVSGAHQGQEIDWQLFRHDRFGKISLLSAVAVQLQSAQLTNYYFGTSTYKANAAKAFELEFIASYPIKKLDFFLGTRNYFYSDEITNSPLTDGNINSQVFAGIGFKFN